MNCSKNYPEIQEKNLDDNYIHLNACPFCNSDNLKRYQQRLDSIWVLLCQECGLGFVEKYPENLQDLYSLDYYEKQGVEEAVIGYCNYQEIKYDYFLWAIALVALTKSNGSLFDLGCSNGLFLDLAKSYGFTDLAGIELTPEYAQICNSKGYNVLSKDFLDIEFDGDKKYDVVTAWAVLEHIPQLNKTLEKIKTILKEDGFLFFEVPCITFTTNDQYWLNSSLEHIFYFTEDSFQSILKKFFGSSYIGRVVTLTNFGSSLIGFITPNKLRLVDCYEINRYLHWINKAEMKSLAIDDLVNYFIINFRYTNNFQLCRNILEYVDQALHNGLNLSNIQVHYWCFLSRKLLSLIAENQNYLEAKEYFLSRIKYLETELQQTQTELQQTQFELQQTQFELQQTQFELQQTQAELQQTQTELQQTQTEIVAMTTSKFWKLRNKWFKVRKILGFVNETEPIGLKALSPVINNLAIKTNITTSESSEEIIELEDNHSKQVEVITQKKWYQARPLVSVIIPCFNYGQYVEAAIDSVLNQTFQDFEIILVDGGSTDETTITTLKSLEKSKTTIYFREGRHLVGDNRNFGIEKAKGRYICCIDADDKIKSTYLEKALFILEKYNYDLVSTSAQCFGNSTDIWHTMIHPTLEGIINGNNISTVAVFSKRIWEKANGYHDYGIGKDYVAEDWDLWVRMAGKGARVINISEPLMLYRVRGKDTSLSSHSESLSFQEQGKIIRAFNQQHLTDEAYKRSVVNNTTSYQVSNGNINLIQSYLKQTEEKDQRKILFALPFVITGGADTIFLQVAQHLSDNGFDISVMTTIKTDANKFGDNTPQYEKITKEIYHLYNFLESEKQWRDFIYYYLESRQVDILFIAGSTYFYDLLPDIKRDFPNLKIVDQLFNECGHIDNNRKHSDLIDLNILANQVIENILIHKYQESKDKTRVIVHGVDTQDEFNPMNIDENIIQNVIPQDKFIISYMGRFSEEKCPLKFVEMVDQLRSYEDIFFIMIGNGPEYESVKQKIANLGLENKVYLPGFVEDNKPFLKETDLLIIPSRIEGIPIILMEALSLGVPVIASQIGGIPDIITNEVNGFVCNPNNIDDFVERIKQIYSDQYLYQKLKLNARNYAVGNLDFSRMNREYLKIFLDLVN